MPLIVKCHASWSSNNVLLQEDLLGIVIITSMNGSRNLPNVRFSVEGWPSLSDFITTLNGNTFARWRFCEQHLGKIGYGNGPNLLLLDYWLRASRWRFGWLVMALSLFWFTVDTVDILPPCERKMTSIHFVQMGSNKWYISQNTSNFLCRPSPCSDGGYTDVRSIYMVFVDPNQAGYTRGGWYRSGGDAWH